MTRKESLVSFGKAIAENYNDCRCYVQNKYTVALSMLLPAASNADTGMGRLVDVAKTIFTTLAVISGVVVAIFLVVAGVKISKGEQIAREIVGPLAGAAIVATATIIVRIILGNSFVSDAQSDIDDITNH